MKKGKRREMKRKMKKGKKRNYSIPGLVCLLDRPGANLGISVADDDCVLGRKRIT